MLAFIKHLNYIQNFKISTTMKKLFTLCLAFAAICSAQAAFFDFEDATANADWQFIQDGQPNFWEINSDVSLSGAYALYITNDGYHYGYNNNASAVSWAYLPVAVTGSESDVISFSWVCMGEGGWDCLSVFLFPEGTLPSAGNDWAEGAITLADQLCDSYDWQHFSVNPVHYGVEAGTYNLCFRWKNDGSGGESAIAIDDVSANTIFSFSLVQDQLTYRLSSDSTATIVACEQSYEGALSLPDSITHVGLTYRITSIEQSAFQGCSALTSITIPSGVTSIAQSAFQGCSALTSITIPSGVTSIDQSAFQGCSALESIVWNAKNYQDFWGEEQTPFYELRDQIKSFTFGDSVKHIPARLCAGYSVTNIVVPYNVTSIGDEAFCHNPFLKSVTLSNNLERISGDLFLECRALKTVTLPNSVQNIGAGAFAFCEALTSITIPNSVTSIGENAFKCCYSLASVTIGSGVTSIGYEAFYDCRTLTYTNYTGDLAGWCGITFDDNLATPLSYSSNLHINGELLTDLVIPEGVTNIKAYAFNNCKSIQSVTIPESVTSIDKYAFEYCGGIRSITWNAKNVADYPAFDATPFYRIGDKYLDMVNMDTITSFTFGDKVERIPAYLCYNMHNLPSISLPESVTHIGSNAFANIPNINIFVHNATPANIGESVVNDMTQHLFVSDVDTFKEAWPDYENHLVALANAKRELTVAALSNMSALHQAIGIEGVGQVVELKVNGTINSYDIMMIRNQMPLLRTLDLSDAHILATENGYEYTDGYTTQDSILTTQMFTGTGTNIHTIILPKSLKHIEAGAFNRNLRALTIHNGTIAESAFRGLDLLNTVNLSNNIRVIPNYAFKLCAALQSINLPDSLESIGREAFRGAGLRTLTIPANVSSIGYGAFTGGRAYYNYYCSDDATYPGCGNYYGDMHLEPVGGYYDEKGNWVQLYNEFHEEVWLEDEGWYAASNLQELIIPENSKLTTIRTFTFEGQPLTKVSLLGKKITTIQDAAFCRCQLDTLILPPNLKKLGTLSFGYCSGLKYIVMPNSITEIPANAFVGCQNLNDIQFPTKLTHIGHHAFADCTNLSNVDIPGLVTSIGDYAFKDCNVNNVYSYLFDPFTIGQNTFSAYANANATLYIPNLESTEFKYLYDTQWSQFLRRVRMDSNFEYDDFYATGDIIIGKDDEALQGNPNVELNPGSGLVVEEGDTIQNLGTINITNDNNYWASILAGCNLNVDTLVLNFNITGRQWHFFGFPFQFKIADIATSGKFVIYEYDGQARAQKDTTGWKKLPASQEYLYPGHGYIFQFNFNGEGTFSIKLHKPNFCQLAEFINLLIYPATKPNNQSWNYVSNPLLAYYDINDLNYTGPITVWDAATSNYRSLRAGDDEYYLSPYEAFFLQNEKVSDDFALFFNKDKALTQNQRDERINAKHHMPAKKAAAPVCRHFINLTIADETNADHTRIVINPNASVGYELAVDAAKFLSTEKVPQIFSYDAAHAMCAINERPMDNGTVLLGIKLPKSGNYRISAERMDTTFYLYDKQENIIHDFQNGDYYFDAKSGLNDQRFELVRTPRHMPTDVEDLTHNTTITPSAEGLIIDGDGYIQIYSMSGVIMAEGQLSGLVQLPAGVYLVVSNGTATKHTVQ